MHPTLTSHDCDETVTHQKRHHDRRKFGESWRDATAIMEAQSLYAHRALVQTMAKQIPAYRWLQNTALLESYQTQHLVVAHDYTRCEGRVTGEGLQCELIGVHPHTGDGHGKWVLRFPFLSGG